MCIGLIKDILFVFLPSLAQCVVFREVFLGGLAKKSTIRVPEISFVFFPFSVQCGGVSECVLLPRVHRRVIF